MEARKFVLKEFIWILGLLGHIDYLDLLLYLLPSSLEILSKNVNTSSEKSKLQFSELDGFFK